MVFAKNNDLLDSTKVCFFIVLRGRRLPLTFHFVGSLVEGGAAIKTKGRREVFLYLVAPLQAAEVHSRNSIFCWRTTSCDNCVVGVNDHNGTTDLMNVFILTNRWGHFFLVTFFSPEIGQNFG